LGARRGGDALRHPRRAVDSGRADRAPASGGAARPGDRAVLLVTERGNQRPGGAATRTARHRQRPASAGRARALERAAVPARAARGGPGRAGGGPDAGYWPWIRLTNESA